MQIQGMFDRYMSSDYERRLTRLVEVLFISPRNQSFQNEKMILQSECRALFYAEEMDIVSETLRVPQLQTIVIKPVPSLDELLQTPEDIELYPYERSFDETRDEPCLILHSSGSTGKPLAY